MKSTLSSSKNFPLPVLHRNKAAVSDLIPGIDFILITVIFFLPNPTSSGNIPAPLHRQYSKYLTYYLDWQRAVGMTKLWVHVDQCVYGLTEDLDLIWGLLCEQRERTGDLVSVWFQSVHASGLNVAVTFINIVYQRDAVWRLKSCIPKCWFYWGEKKFMAHHAFNINCGCSSLNVL